MSKEKRNPYRHLDPRYAAQARARDAALAALGGLGLDEKIHATTEMLVLLLRELGEAEIIDIARMGIEAELGNNLGTRASLFVRVALLEARLGMLK